MNRAAAWIPVALALAGCGAPEASTAGGDENVARSTIQPPVGFPPWKADGDCYWVLTHADGVAHRAWISGNDEGLFLSVVDDAIVKLPLGDALRFELVADGDAARQVEARARHTDGDGATLLTLILDEPQRALIKSARVVSVSSQGRRLLDLPTDSLPGAAELDACDRNPGAGRFSEE